MSTARLNEITDLLAVIEESRVRLKELGVKVNVNVSVASFSDILDEATDEIATLKVYERASTISHLRNTYQTYTPTAPVNYRQNKIKDIQEWLKGRGIDYGYFFNYTAGIPDKHIDRLHSYIKNGDPSEKDTEKLLKTALPGYNGKKVQPNAEW